MEPFYLIFENFNAESISSFFDINWDIFHSFKQEVFSLLNSVLIPDSLAGLIEMILNKITGIQTEKDNFLETYFTEFIQWISQAGTGVSSEISLNHQNQAIKTV